MPMSEIIKNWARKMGLISAPEPEAPAPSAPQPEAPARRSGMGMGSSGRMGAEPSRIPTPPAGSYAQGVDVLWVSMFPDLGAWLSPQKICHFATWYERQSQYMKTGRVSKFVDDDGFTASLYPTAAQRGVATLIGSHGQEESFDCQINPDAHRAYIKCDSGVIEVDTLNNKSRLIPAPERDMKSAYESYRAAERSSSRPRSSAPLVQRGSSSMARSGSSGYDTRYVYSDNTDLSDLALALWWANSSSSAQDQHFHGAGGTFDGGGSSGDWDSQPVAASGTAGFSWSSGEGLLTASSLASAPIASSPPAEFDAGPSGSASSGGWDADPKIAPSEPAIDLGPASSGFDSPSVDSTIDLGSASVAEPSFDSDRTELSTNY